MNLFIFHRDKGIFDWFVQKKTIYEFDARNNQSCLEYTLLVNLSDTLKYGNLDLCNIYRALYFKVLYLLNSNYTYLQINIIQNLFKHFFKTASSICQSSSNVPSVSCQPSTPTASTSSCHPSTPSASTSSCIPSTKIIETSKMTQPEKCKVDTPEKQKDSKAEKDTAPEKSKEHKLEKGLRKDPPKKPDKISYKPLSMTAAVIRRTRQSKKAAAVKQHNDCIDDDDSFSSTRTSSTMGYR